MPNTFIAEKGFIESYDMPWLLHIIRKGISYVIVFFFNLVTLFALWPILEPPQDWTVLLAIPGVFLVMLAGSGIGLALAVIAARFRDVMPLVQLATGFMFIFTPVFWKRQSLTENTFVVDWNPLYYLLEVVRGPLTGALPSVHMWIGAAIGAVVCLVVGLVCFALGRRHLYHWIS